MRTLKIIALLSMVFLLIQNAHAQDSITITFTTKDKFLAGNGGVFHDGTLQEFVTLLEWQNGVYVSIFGSRSFNLKKDFGDEEDITVGKKGTRGRWNYLADINYYRIAVRDVMNINGELSKDIKFNNRFHTSPFLRVEYYFPAQTEGPRKGLIVLSGMKTIMPLSKRLSLQTDAWLKKDAGAFGFDSGLLGQGYLGLNYQATPKWNLFGGIKGSTPFSHLDDGRKTARALSFGFSYKVK